MQYTAIFHGCKNGNFQMKNCDVFLMFAQNIDCGYTYLHDGLKMLVLGPMLLGISCMKRP